MAEDFHFSNDFQMGGHWCYSNGRAFSNVHTSRSIYTLQRLRILNWVSAAVLFLFHLSGGGDGDFVAGFLLGGELCGTLAYIFAPQIRRSLLNEDEYGFRRAKQPIYYDEGLEGKPTLVLLKAWFKHQRTY